MWGRSDENWHTKHAKWINMCNNRHKLMLIGRPMHGPLFHSREYMKWYIANSIYLLLVLQLLNDSCTHRKPPPDPTFLAAANYNNEQHDPY